MSNSQSKVIYLNFFDQINEVKAKAVMAACADILNQQKPDALYFLFSSPGGLVEAGITLYNYLRSLPVEIIMHNTGSIDSIANVVFLAGSKRYAAKHSSFLFHGITWTFPGGVGINRNQLTENLSSLDSSETKVSGVITERTKLTSEEIRSLFSQGESKDPAFALEKGIINEIKNPSVQKGDTLLSFNINP